FSRSRFTVLYTVAKEIVGSIAVTRLCSSIASGWSLESERTCMMVRRGPVSLRPSSLQIASMFPAIQALHDPTCLGLAAQGTQNRLKPSQVASQLQKVGPGGSLFHSASPLRQLSIAPYGSIKLS